MMKSIMIIGSQITLLFLFKSAFYFSFVSISSFVSDGQTVGSAILIALLS